MRVLGLIARCFPLIFFVMLYEQLQKGDTLQKDLPPDERKTDVRTAAMGYSLPLFLAWLFVVFILVMGWQGFEDALYFTMPIVLILSIYYVVLLALLPLCRRFFRARDCALMWILPSALFYSSYQNLWRPVPRWLLYIPPTVLKMFMVVWVSGAVGLMVYYLLNNYRYRRLLLNVSYPAEDAAKALWWAELDQVGWQGNIPLVISPEARTPVTMGLQKKNLVVILPQRRYTVAEYRMIFRHELRHIIRQDASVKFFWCFLKSICWFNPLIWIAARKACDDMELSCDEYVLREADDTTRREYAKLLLDTAGDSRGFSTCLSAAASTLRHRLRCAVAPKKRYSGFAFLFVAMLLLCLFNGKIAVAEGRGVLGDYLDLNDHKLIQAYYRVVEGGHAHFSHYRDMDGHEKENELISHLLSRKVTKLHSIDRVDEEDFADDSWREYTFQGEKETLWITVKDGWLLVTRVGVNRSMSFRLESELDWTLLDACTND